MERRFTIHDFEKSLREQSDEFRMIPSKRVWHGIYNDLHPGRRWPSYTTSLLLLFSLLFVGYMNSNQKPHAVINPKLAGVSEVPGGGNSPAVQSSDIAGSTTRTSGSHFLVLGNEGSNHYHLGLPAVKDAIQVSEKVSLFSAYYLAQPAGLAVQEWSPSLSEWATRAMSADPLSPAPERFSPARTLSETGHLNANTASNELSSVVTPADRTGIQSSISEATLNNELLNAPVNTYKKPVEFDIAFRKAVNAKRRRQMARKYEDQKSSWLYYVTPQLNSVAFHGAPITASSAVNYTTSVTIMPGSYKLLHYQAIGFQAGAQMNYRMLRKLSFTSGFQLSYSGYNIISNEVHPTFATLFLRDPSSKAIYPRSYISHYGDGTGQTAVSLRNYSLQLSLPVGVAYEVAGNSQVQFNLAADIAPSFVLKSNAYILSSDGNNYVNDPTLIRKLNAASNFGFYVSFWSSRVRWQIGPNIRYQWFSTYKRDYSIGEHLVDYGIRIGISR